VLVWSAPVRYAECDAQGVVFNGHYLTWCDEAVTAWLVQSGIGYEQLLGRGLDFFVVRSELSWSSSARWGDTVDVDVVRRPLRGARRRPDVLHGRDDVRDGRAGQEADARPGRPSGRLLVTAGQAAIRVPQR
jgi:hypothetical protein